MSKTESHLAMRYLIPKRKLRNNTDITDCFAGNNEIFQ